MENNSKLTTTSKRGPKSYAPALICGLIFIAGLGLQSIGTAFRISNEDGDNALHYKDLGFEPPDPTDQVETSAVNRLADTISTVMAHMMEGNDDDNDDDGDQEGSSNESQDTSSSLTFPNRPAACRPEDRNPFVPLSQLKIPAIAGQPSRRRLRVGLGTSFPLQGESIHVMYDGIIGSDYMELVQMCNVKTQNAVHEPTPKTYRNYTSNCTIHDGMDVELWVLDVVRARMQPRFEHNSFLQHLWFDGSPDSWKLLLMEYSDRVYAPVFFNKIRPHRNLTEGEGVGIQNKHHIRTAIRMVVHGRNYSAADKLINLGEVKVPEKAHTKGGNTTHVSYPVRTDLVSHIKTVILDKLNKTNVTASFLPSTEFDNTIGAAPVYQWSKEYVGKSIGPKCLPPPYATIREHDVAHFWPMTVSTYGFFRNDVTRTVQTLKRKKHPTEDRTIDATVTMSGKPGREGRNVASVQYAEALLEYKILIVTGRDNWEDHYRLMEALAAGAMVLSDVMLSLPKFLKDGESVVFFRDLPQLEELVLYYLEHDDERMAIAKKGWEIAMGFHRSWHRMERVTFGCPLTKVNRAYEEYCP